MLFKEIIGKYYPSDDNLRRLLLHHSRQVAERVEKIVRCHPEWEVDSSFLEDAAGSASFEASEITALSMPLAASI